MSYKTELGKLGEDFACRYLQAQGYKIVFRNYRTRFGEIDIIAEKNNVLSFVEVKTRASQKFGMPAEAVTLAKQKKIHRCAEAYLQFKGIISLMPKISFDVIEIISEGNAVKEFKHYPHCF